MIYKKQQTGLTLIEVMVSLSLGVFFLTVAMQYLIAGQETFRSQDSGTRIQENSRFSMQLIREQVRLAGYAEVESLALPPIFRGSCGQVNGQIATNCSDDVPATAVTQGDRLALASVPFNAQDCLGNATASAITQIANVFYVAEDADGVSSLYCRAFDINTNGWNANAVGQPLVNGIDQMQVQYGLIDINGNVDRYANATEVEALNAWGNVRSVKVALLVNSGIETDEGQIDGNTLTADILTDQYTDFTLLDGEYTRQNDRKIRRVYETTIAVYNP